MNRADQIVTEAWRNLPELGRFASKPAAVYGDHLGMVDVGMTLVMPLACNMRRSGFASSRADAMEQAFDHLLQKHLPNKYERVGETAIIEVGMGVHAVRALCQSLDKGGG